MITKIKEIADGVKTVFRQSDKVYIPKHGKDFLVSFQFPLPYFER